MEADPKEFIRSVVDPNRPFKEIKALLEEPGNENFKDGVIDKEEGRLIDYAAQVGNLQLVKYLLRLNPNQLHFHRASNGADVLQFAVCSGNIELVKFLIEQGANTQYKYFMGTSLLFFALKKRQFHVFKYLVEECGMKPFDNLADNGITALYMAMDYEDKDLFMYVLKFNPLLDNLGHYNYLAHAIRLQDTFYLDELLKRNAPLEILEPNFRSAFSWAGEENKHKHMELILKKCKGVKPEPLLEPNISKISHEYNALCYKWQRLYDIYLVRYFYELKKKKIESDKAAEEFMKNNTLAAIYESINYQSNYATILFRLPHSIFKIVMSRLDTFQPKFDLTNS